MSTDVLAAFALTVLLLPTAGAIALGASALRLPRGAVKLVGPGVVWAAFACVMVLFADSLAGGAARNFKYWTWIGIGGFHVPFNLLVDRLSIYMCIVITGVGGLIVTYAVGYMSHEKDASFARFFCYMDLFILSMLLLVLAGNFVFLIVGWAAVGLSSFLLIGFYYWRPSAVVAARKAFVMNVVGDIGMILAAFVVFVNYHATTYPEAFARIPHGDGFTVELAAFLLLVGAVAKSAQLPLHTWLPDAMEGPTPVSALIHAATMVTAGVYLICRMNPIFGPAVWASGTAALIGAVTALGAATIAIVQTDIKRVLAYSTMSQIGYMFLGAGIGAYSAALFHLLSHAFFKALLFMSAGNVIHAMDDEQEMSRFGGLWRDLRLTSWVFLIGSLSLVGIFPFIGFFSKELVLGEALTKPGLTIFPQVLWVIGFVTAVLTGFYTGRMWWIAFAGKPSPDRPVAHPREAPPVMMGPVLVLAALTTVGGVLDLQVLTHSPFAPVADFLAPVVGRPGWEETTLDYAATGLATTLGGLAFLAAYNFYASRAWPVWSRALPWAQRLLEHKYYFDEIYDAVFVRPLDALARAGDRFMEEPVLDGLPEGVALTTRSAAASLAWIQSGYFRTYVLVFTGGVVVAGAVLLIWEFG